MQIELLEIDFNSEEAIYIQLRNQVILGIATANIHEGDSLPSVRQLAETIGVNMHTGNRDIQTAGRRYASVGKTDGRMYRDQYAYSK